MPSEAALRPPALSSGHQAGLSLDAPPAHLPLSPTSEFSEKLAGAPSHPPRQCLPLAPVTGSGGG